MVNPLFCYQDYGDPSVNEQQARYDIMNMYGGRAVVQLNEEGYTDPSEDQLKLYYADTDAPPSEVISINQFKLLLENCALLPFFMIMGILSYL